MITSHTMDLENAAALGQTATTVRGGTAEDALDADVVVLSAAVPLHLNSSRLVSFPTTRASSTRCWRHWPARRSPASC